MSKKNTRKKVSLAPGHSQSDWLAFSAAHPITDEKAATRRITIEELQEHNRKDDAWIALHGKVYCVTEFIEYHPGGAEILLHACGKDGTELWNRYHPWLSIDGFLGNRFLGFLVKGSRKQPGVEKATLLR